MADKQDDLFNQKRDFFRIKYPVEEQPTLLIGKTEYIILDLSEKGIKFKLNPNQSILSEVEIKGKLYFDNEKTLVLRGILSFNSSSTIIFTINDDHILKSLTEQTTRNNLPHKLEFGDLSFNDIKISNNTIEIQDRTQSLFKSMPAINAKVVFSDNNFIEVAGTFLRIVDNQSVLLLSLSIPYQKILSEQLKLINKYAGYME
ncbi:MAG: hypothetical protein A2Y40_06790 [Candidatus Margulisbacteria bacterium GWF2_35_9]|nr:MAG: hypothetical protein A2Y40_06790 [Candidatus Margulisbacteria bacterium GWF2_35_9]